MAKRKVTGQTKDYLDKNEEAKAANPERDQYLIRHEQARELYGPQIQKMLLVDQVYRADWTPPQELADSDIEFVGMSRAEVIVQKYTRVLGIRSTKTFNVPPHANTSQEQARCDTLERVLQAYYRMHWAATGSDIWRMVTHMTVLRGRAGIHTLYMPGEEEQPQIRQLCYDPLTYFPIRKVGGQTDWFSKEVWLSTYAMKEYLEGLGLDMPEVEAGDEGYEPLNNSIRLVEIWDKDGYCQVVGPQTVNETELGYGRVTLQEARLGETAMDMPEWSCRPLLAPILPELQGYASLMSKMATGVQELYWPIVIVKDADGTLRHQRFDQRGPLEEIDMGENTQVTVLNPQPNDRLLSNLKNDMNEDISKATMSPVAFSQDIPGSASGNLYDTVLGQIQDDLADVRSQLEHVFGAACGDVLWMLQRFADEQEGGYWEFAIDARPEQRQMSVQITADDIADHFYVEASVKPALPEDKVRNMTIYNQGRQPNPATGVPDLPRSFMISASGLEGLIPDRSEFDRAYKEEVLMANDPEFKATTLAAWKAEFVKKQLEDQKAAEKAMHMLEEKTAAQKMKAIQDGTSTDGILPAEIKTDPAAMGKIAQLMASGQTYEQALGVVQSGAGMGMDQAPGGDQANKDRARKLAQQLLGGELPVAGDGQQSAGQNMPATAPQPVGAPNPTGSQMPGQAQMTGTQGYNTGIPTGVASPAQLGAVPRSQVDPSNLQAEAIIQQIARGQRRPPR